MSFKRHLPLAIAAAVATVAALPAAAQAGARVTTCPGSFQVLHNDRIGAMQLPAGPYRIRTTGGLSCSAASNLFADFLEDWDGNLPGAWRIRSARNRSFVRGRGPVGFSVRPIRGGGGGGGGNALTCPGTFQVLHNDRIGSLRLPRGPYRITVLRTQGLGLSCVQAARLFAEFLEYPSGNLPAPWSLNAGTSTFTNRQTGLGFRVRRAGGGGGGGGRPTGATCPGTFQVLHNDRIGRLRLPRGFYRIVVRNMTCTDAASQFRTFLDFPGGNLPRPWVLDPSNATFSRGRGSSTSFRVERT